MKSFMFGLTASLLVAAHSGQAQEMVIVDGEEYPLAALTENCQSLSGEPQAMIACFNALSALLEGQTAAPVPDVSVGEALQDLRAAAQYQDDQSGLVIAGDSCLVQIVYYGNYYYLSRRNISTIDLYSAQFDASKFQYDQISQASNGPVPVYRGQLEVGVFASTRGGLGLDSDVYGFEAKSARASLPAYASEVIGQLTPTEGTSFEFPLIHPARADNSAAIWNAFETFVNVCRG